MLVVDRFELLVVAVPMRLRVKHALAERRTARNLLVRAIARDGIVGFGECCPREYVTGESIESAIRTLTELLPAFVGRTFGSFDAAQRSVQELLVDLPRAQHAAFGAAELALLDLAGRRFGASAGDVLGPIRRERVVYSGVIATDDPREAALQSAFLAKMRVRAVKVKVSRDLAANRELLASARAALGDGVELRIDANCAWTAADAIEQLRALRALGLAGCEQPVAADDVAGMAAVTAARLVPVVADESLCTLADARRLIAARACNVFNLRVSKNGGLCNVARLAAAAAAAGLDCQLGAQVGETGILSAAGRQVATRLPSLRWLEGSYGTLLLDHDLTEPDVTVGPGGEAPALRGDGLGVAVDEQQLAACVEQRIAIGAQGQETAS
jgi:muconate cycloisomerase